MKEPVKQLKKSYRSVNLHKYGQELVRTNYSHIYLYVHICSNDTCYLIKYLSQTNSSSQDKSLYLPTKKLDLDITTEFQIQINPNTTLHVCKVQTLINPNLLAYKINYLYLEKLDTNINLIKKMFEYKPFYYTNGLNQKKLIEYKQDEIIELEKLLDDLRV